MSLETRPSPHEVLPSSIAESRARLEMAASGLGARYFADIDTRPSLSVTRQFYDVNEFVAGHGLRKEFSEYEIAGHFGKIVEGLESDLAARTEILFRAVLALREFREDRKETLQVPDADLIQAWALQLIGPDEFAQIAGPAFGEWGPRLADNRIPHIVQANEWIGNQAAKHLIEQGRTEGIRIADLGSGTGSTMLATITALREEGIGIDDVKGVELSQTLVDTARAHFAEGQYGNVSIDTANAMTWLEEQPDESLDVITMVYAIHHLPYDQQRQLEEIIYRKLRPGGMFAIADPTGRSKFNLENLDINEPEATAACFRPYLSEVARKFQEVGLTVNYRGFEPIPVNDFNIPSTQQGDTLDQGTLGYALIGIKPNNPSALDGISLTPIATATDERHNELLQLLTQQPWFQSLPLVLRQSYATLPTEILERSVLTTKEGENRESVLEQRLSLIRDVWRQFSETHGNEPLETMSYERATILGNELIARIATALKIPADASLGKLLPEHLQEQVMGFTSGGVLVKRHGEQTHTTTPNTSPTDLKIEMMQDPANWEDQAGLISLAEAAGDAFALLYTFSQTHKAIALNTSPDHRALDVARVFETILGVQAQSLESLRCMRYLNPQTDEARAILTQYKGTVPWQENLIDAVAGQGTYQLRKTNIINLVTDALNNPDIITVFIGHSQELQEISGDPTLRARELGYVAVPNDTHNAQTQKDGLFGATKTTLLRLQAEYLRMQPGILSEALAAFTRR